MKLYIYIVQQDDREGGKILLVTFNKDEAEQLCMDKILEDNSDIEDNPVDADIHRRAKRMKRKNFLELYLGSAWITTPTLTEWILDYPTT